MVILFSSAQLESNVFQSPGREASAPPSPSPVITDITVDYNVSPEELASMTRDQDFSALQNFGGVKGLAEKLNTNPNKGINDVESNIVDKKILFGSNTYQRKNEPSFWRSLSGRCRDTKIIILMVAAATLLALGIISEGIKDGWYDGGSIAFAVIILTVVRAIVDYKKSLQFQKLYEEKQNIQLKCNVLRGGRRVEISKCDVVVGDVILLQIGDQVPADGVFISGWSLCIYESNMTEDCKIVHKDHNSPFLRSGWKVADGLGTMLVTSVGIHTEWELLMANTSEDNEEETPLQVRLKSVAMYTRIVGIVVALSVLVILLIRFFTGHMKNDEGKLKFTAGKTSVLDAVYGVIRIITVAVGVVVVAVSNGLRLAVTLTLAYSMRKMISDKALVVSWGRCIYTNIQKLIQFQLTVYLTALVITIVAAVSSGDVPLNVVQLIWVSLITNTLGALALVTEPPTDHLMDRLPIGPREPLITRIMWWNSLIQAFYQVSCLLVLNFLDRQLLHAINQKNTLIFNVFVFAQIFNKFNARRPDEINVFKGVTKDRLFMGIVGLTVVLQVIIVMFLGKFTTTVRLSWQSWLVSIAIGFFSWPVATIGKFRRRPLADILPTYSHHVHHGVERQVEMSMMSK